MAANINRRDIKRNLRKMKREFLEQRGSEGGEKFEFINTALGSVDEVLRGVGLQDALNEVLASMAASVWEHKSTKNEDQLVIAGCEIDQEIRFPDSEAPSGYRTVLSSHVTFRQHLLSIEMREAEHKKLGDKIEIERKANEAGLRRANGDLDALMSMYTDIPHSKAA